MDIAALVVGFMLPWALGVVLIVRVSPRTGSWGDPGKLAWTLGCGWFAGAFVLTLWMRVLAAAGAPFEVVTIAAPLAAVTGALAWFAWRRAGAELPAALRRS